MYATHRFSLYATIKYVLENRNACPELYTVVKIYHAGAKIVKSGYDANVSGVNGLADVIGLANKYLRRVSTIDPAYSVHVRMSRLADGRFYVRQKMVQIIPQIRSVESSLDRATTFVAHHDN